MYRIFALSSTRSLRWHSPRAQTARQSFTISAGWTIRVYLQSKLLGSGWEAAIHPDDLPRILETFREALKSGKPYELEGRFRHFDGEFRWFLFRGSPLRDQSEKVAKWYGTNTDLEERKRAEDAPPRERSLLARCSTANPHLQLETRGPIREGDSLPGRACNVRH